MNWEPTDEYRTVTREEAAYAVDGMVVTQARDIRQRKWARPVHTESGLHFANLYEWRDVPLVRGEE